MKQELINKYLKGETNQEENNEMLNWIETSSENRKQYLQYRRLYDAAIWSESKESRETPEFKQGRYISLIKKWMQVAAVIAIVVIGTLFIQRSFDGRDRMFTQTIEVPFGQRVNLTLSDGTKVSLNSNSKLHFPSAFNGKERKVILDGEGFFEVAHNASKPFHVVTEKYEIKVLGTTFNLLAYNNSDIFETSLIEGSVLVSNNSDNQTVMLSPNEKVFAKQNQLVKTTFDSQDDFLWRNGIYVFKNESLSDVFKKLEDYYQIDIVVKNKQISTYNCTAKFRQKEGIEHIIKVLQTANNFNYKRDEDKNIIVIY